MINNDNFKKWFGDSEVVDEGGNPLVLYHGTTHDFDSFSLEKGNIDNAVGVGYYFTSSPEDASINYAGIGADLTGRINKEIDEITSEIELNLDVDEIVEKYGVTKEEAQSMSEGENPDLIEVLARREAKKRMKGSHDGAIIPAYVKMEKPFDLTEEGKRIFIEVDDEYYEEMAKDEVDKEDYEDDDEYNDAITEKAQQIYYEDYSPSEEGEGLPIFEATQATTPQYEDIEDFDVYDLKDKLKDGMTPKEVYDYLKESFVYATDEEGNHATNQVINDIIRAAGYDGVIQDAYVEFGQGREKGGAMEGIEWGDRHYIVFEPTQIKSAIGNNGEYDPNNPNIVMEKGGSVTTWKHKYNKKYGYPKNKSHSLKEISKDTDVSMKGIRQIYNKGIGAYKTNPSSVRPSVKSKEQWAMARVYSSVMGGDAAKIDSKELKMEKGGEMKNIDNSILIDRKTKEKLTLGDVKSIIKNEYDSNGITFSEQHISSWSPMDRSKNDYIDFPSEFRYRLGFDLGHNSNTDSSTKEEREYMESIVSDLKKYVKGLNSNLDKESLTHKYFNERTHFSKGGSIKSKWFSGELEFLNW